MKKLIITISLVIAGITAAKAQTQTEGKVVSSASQAGSSLSRTQESEIEYSYKPQKEALAPKNEEQQSEEIQEVINSKSKQEPKANSSEVKAGWDIKSNKKV
jgi:hypothetical protein